MPRNLVVLDAKNLSVRSHGAAALSKLSRLAISLTPIVDTNENEGDDEQILSEDWYQDVEELLAGLQLRGLSLVFAKNGDVPEAVRSVISSLVSTQLEELILIRYRLSDKELLDVVLGNERNKRPLLRSLDLLYPVLGKNPSTETLLNLLRACHQLTEIKLDRSSDSWSKEKFFVHETALLDAMC